MSDNSGNEVVVSEQGDDQLDFGEFSKFFPLSIRRHILAQMVAGFPEPMKDRVRALKQLQVESTKLEASFYKEVYGLECKYQDMYNKLNAKRSDIIRGVYQPTPEESKFKLSESSIDEKLREMKIYDTAKNKICISHSHPEGTPGIPDFWLQTFRNVYMLSDMVEEHDEPAFKHLQDIRVLYKKEPMGFTLEFYFSPNEYFTNSVLSKEYIMSCSPKTDDPFAFDGPEIIQCKGCTIDWLPGKDLTTIPGDDNAVYLNKQPDPYLESFFNFFAPPEVSDKDKDEETGRRLAYDHEIAHYIRERIVPRAVLYYTGEGIETEEDEEEEDDEDESSYCDEEELEKASPKS